MHSNSKLQRWKNLACALAVLALAPGCAGGSSPLLTPDPTGAPLFEQGQDALVVGDWRDAVTAFDTLLRNYPSSPFLAEARLGMGRAYYEQGRVDTLIMAIDAFQSFLTYHPSHKDVDYAQYMVGMTYVAQMHTADRDQGPTRQAINAFQLLLDNYPESSLYADAARRRLEGLDQLAMHELQVARWQAGRDEDWDAAIDRVKYALGEYPETSIKCDLHFTMGEAYMQGKRLEDARVSYEVVVNEFPDCELVDEAQERLREITGG